MRLSQGHLKLLETCPRQFQHLYLEQLAAPIAAEQAERLTWGSRFHQLLQQRELALPIAPLLAADPELAQQFHTLTVTVPEIASLLVPDPGLRESEHERTIEFQGHSLVVVYDLLIADTEQAHIFDWKTYPQPSDPQRLQQDWQTRLYLWVLAATSTYAPEQIRMTYWFAQGEQRVGRRELRVGRRELRDKRPEEPATTIAEDNLTPHSSPLTPLTPTSVTIAYSEAQHERTTQDLTRLLKCLSDWHDRYQQGKDFPQVAEGMGICRYCQFVTRCQREKEQAPPDEIVLNLGAIAEIPF